MAKKKTTEEIILEGFGNVRQSRVGGFLRTLTDEEYCGYVSGMILAQHPSIPDMPGDVVAKVRELFKAGKL